MKKRGSNVWGLYDLLKMLTIIIIIVIVMSII